MGIKVLWIYPNTYGMYMIPPAIALLSAIIKKHDHKSEIFDLTFYAADHGIDSDGSRAEILNTLPFNMEDRNIRLKTSDWKDDLYKQVERFQPDLIAISSTEDMWELGIKALEHIENLKIKNNIPVVAGGVFATFAPDICLEHRLIDMVCVGEGEDAIVDLCNKIQKGDDYSDVTNLCFKDNDGGIKKNKIAKLVDVDTSPILDLDLFEENRLYRPMAGKIWKTVPIETHRGCPFTCAFCNSPDQQKLYKEETGGSFFRKKSIDKIYDELIYFKEEIGLELVFFWADTFLAWNKKELDEFCEMYKEIKLPFWMQTRPETVNEEKLKKLKDVGLMRMAFGLEHGNEQFRNKLLDRRWKNKDIVEAMKVPKELDIDFSVNNITGFPTETRELVFDTIEINREIEATNYNIYTFVPFHGTPLRKLTDKLELTKHSTITKCLSDKSQLYMPQYTPEQIEGIKRTFVLYVKFPKNRWKEIERAEKFTPEGNAIFKELQLEYIDKYMPKSDDDLHASKKVEPHVRKAITKEELTFGLEPNVADDM
jgi:anaerobic magnesium-protoporphyrin IX monomethyl ester cyclase